MSADLKYGTLYQHLVHNEVPIRQSAMRRLREFISSKEPNEDDEIDETTVPGLEASEMAKIWRGLFYCYWMSDKPDVQQEFARNLAMSLHLWTPYTSLTFFNAFLETMADRWPTIDHNRMDKYLSLLRRMLEAMFIYLRVYEWDEVIVEQFTEIIGHTLRKVGSSRRGIGLQIIQMYIKSYAIAYGQDVFFNEINIDQILKDNDYDENITLEDIYYNQYMGRKNDIKSDEARARFHAKRASKKEGAAPLEYKYTKQGWKEAKKAQGPPRNPETGKLMYTNPIAYLLNRKQKKLATEDTPDIKADIVKASKKQVGPTPEKALISLLDVLLNCYKLSNKDAALHESLQDNFRAMWVQITTRFVDNAEFESRGEENPAPETANDALGHTAAASLRAFSLYLREKAKQADDLPYEIDPKTKQPRLKKQPNVANLSLAELPTTSNTRRIYNGIASQLEAQISRLVQMEIDFDQLEAADFDFDGEGEGEFDPSMFGLGEGEFDPSMMDFDGEGELSEEEIAHYMAAMNGEGEFADDFDGQMMDEDDEELDEVDQEEDVEDEDEDNEVDDAEVSAFRGKDGKIDLNMLNGFYQAGCGDGEGEGFEGEFDLPPDFEGDDFMGFGEGFDFEGEGLDGLDFEGEGFDGFDFLPDDGLEFDQDEDEDEDEDADEDDDLEADDEEVTLETLVELFGSALKFSNDGSPQLTKPMYQHLARFIQHRRMIRQAQAAQSALSKKNTKQNQKIAQEYLPQNPNSKWNYGILSDEDEDTKPNPLKRKQGPGQVAAAAAGPVANKKQKRAEEEESRLVNFALQQNTVQTFSKKDLPLKNGAAPATRSDVPPPAIKKKEGVVIQEKKGAEKKQEQPKKQQEQPKKQQQQQQQQNEQPKQQQPKQQQPPPQPKQTKQAPAPAPAPSPIAAPTQKKLKKGSK